MRKSLVYYFYCTRETVFNEINRLHFECLKRYNSIFNDIKFCISVNDINDKELIKMVQEKVMEVFNNNFSKISFYIYKNNIELCECSFFYDEIILKLDEYDLVFFGHNKGFLTAKEEDKISLYHWAIGMYYFSLGFIEELEHSLIESDEGLFYGSFLRKFNPMESPNNIHYTGTYFWMNAQRLKKYIETNKQFFLKPYSRYYAENFPGHYLEQNLCTHNNVLLNKYNYNFYCDSIQIIQELYPNEIDFYSFYNNIIDNVKL
jgi:hypothetical protein